MRATLRVPGRSRSTKGLKNHVYRYNELTDLASQVYIAPDDKGASMLPSTA